LKAWKQLLAEGKVESLATKQQVGDYVQRILQTAPLK
jgi:hypothetical protein